MSVRSIIRLLLFTGIVGVFAWYKTRKQKIDTLNGLFLANRSLGFLFVAGALLFSNINTASILGGNELTYTPDMPVTARGVHSCFPMLFVSEFFNALYVG